MKFSPRQSAPHRARLKFATVAAAAALAALAGCAYTPPPTVIAPELPAEVTVIDKDTALVLSVTDERGDAAANDGGEVMPAIETAVLRLFARKGYNLVTRDDPHDARLTVAVRAFDYQVETGRWSSDEEAAAVFVAEAVRGASRRTSTYRSAGERQAALDLYRQRPGATPSGVLSDILARIAADAELQRFLTGN